MGIITLLYPLSIFWAVLHLAQRFFASRPRQSSNALLPSFAGPHGTISHRFRSPRAIKYTLWGLSLRVETTRFNDFHDSCIVYFKQRRHSLIRQRTTKIYDFGTLTGVAGQLAAIGLLWLTTYRSVWTAVHSIQTPVGTTTLHKRNWEPETRTSELPLSDRPSPPLQLIIPGVTVPLSHLPLLLTALLISQIIHELGHAVAAALESVPLSSIGASLHIIIPSAFVALPVSPVQALQPFARLRIISAGAFHNLVFWIFLVIISWLRIGHFVWTTMGYQDVGSFGRVVIAVEETSPLWQFLPPRSIITALDDQSLSVSGSAEDIWTTYLSETQRHPHKHELGWCVEQTWILGQPISCCDSPLASSPNATCFVLGDTTSDTTSLQRCVPPLSILQPESAVHRRCEEPAHCASGHLCAKLQNGEELLRITFHTPESNDLSINETQLFQTIVWSGPREELLADVVVSDYFPRYTFLPPALPVVVGTFLQYLSTLTLSLYFLNLLPFPYLDGSHLLEALLDVAQSKLKADTTADLALRNIESGAVIPRSRTSTPASWRTRVQFGAQSIISVLILVSVACGLFAASR